MAELNKFVEENLELLNLERQTEINESKAFYENSDSTTLQSKGVCLKKLLTFTRKTGLYGRVLLTFGKAKTHCPKNVPLPSHCITVGMTNSMLST